MIELLKKDGSPATISAAHITRLQRDYPRLDVQGELVKMKNWLESNPSKRKVNVDRFIVNWLNRAKPLEPGVTPQTSRHYALVADRIRPPAEPYREPRPETVSRCMGELRKLLGMRPNGPGDQMPGDGLLLSETSGASQQMRVRE